MGTQTTSPVRTQGNSKKSTYYSLLDFFQNVTASIVLVCAFLLFNFKSTSAQGAYPADPHWIKTTPAINFLLLNYNQASAQVTCPADPHWMETTPPINADHIFCGEIKSDTAKGFHSRPGGINPATVENFVVTQQPNANGVYAGTLTLVNPNGSNPSKFSSIFPDSCTEAQVVQSVLYAQANSETCPAGAPNGASCGMNRPATDDGTKYCIGDDAKSRFTIAFATLNNGNINTAFPIR